MAIQTFQGAKEKQSKLTGLVLLYLALIPSTSYSAFPGFSFDCPGPGCPASTDSSYESQAYPRPDYPGSVGGDGEYGMGGGGSDDYGYGMGGPAGMSEYVEMYCITSVGYCLLPAGSPLGSACLCRTYDGFVQGFVSEYSQ